MKVIFIKDVPGMGKKDEIKELNDGYVRNFLLPKGLVQIATPTAISKIESSKNAIRIEKEIQHDLLIKNLKSIEGIEITLKLKANEHGHLFSSIHAKDLVLELYKQKKITVDEKYIILDKPIKELGETEVLVKIDSMKAVFKTRVIPV